VTGFGQERDRERARHAAFDHFFLKPADPDALPAVLADRAARLVPAPERHPMCMYGGEGDRLCPACASG